MIFIFTRCRATPLSSAPRFGTPLTVFHFILEPCLEGAICVAAEEPEGEVATTVMRTLHVVPRVGLGVISLALLLMMIGARGL